MNENAKHRLQPSKASSKEQRPTNSMRKNHHEMLVHCFTSTFFLFFFFGWRFIVKWKYQPYITIFMYGENSLNFALFCGPCCIWKPTPSALPRLHILSSTMHTLQRHISSNFVLRWIFCSVDFRCIMPHGPTHQPEGLGKGVQLLTDFRHQIYYKCMGRSKRAQKSERDLDSTQSFDALNVCVNREQGTGCRGRNISYWHTIFMLLCNSGI